jgi:hypothetical protein
MAKQVLGTSSVKDLPKTSWTNGTGRSSTFKQPTTKPGNLTQATPDSKAIFKKREMRTKRITMATPMAKNPQEKGKKLTTLISLNKGLNSHFRK